MGHHFDNVELRTMWADDNDPSDVINESSIYKAPDPASLLRLPFSMYPLHDVNEFVILWNVQLMPTGATYVRITPFAGRSILRPGLPTQVPPLPGWSNLSATRVYDMYTMSFLDLDISTGLVTPYRFKLNKTAADGQVIIDDGNGGSYGLARGTTVQLPFAFPYLYFYVETDGTNGTGSQSLTANISMV